MKAHIDSLDLNSPERFCEIRSILEKKPSLRSLYHEVYMKYADCIKQCTAKGPVIELGSGAGFVKEVIPEIITSDIVPYPHIDRVLNATNLDFPDQSLACICMFNVLHHIPDTPAFFKEAIRCLLPGGRVFMIEPYAGWLSSWVFTHLHHEDFDKQVACWEFKSKGPVSDANNALPWIIFERDREKFQKEFKELKLLRFEPQMPLRYWLTGGLKKWSLLPQWAYQLSCWLDKKLIQLSPRWASFVEIELIRI